MPRDHRWGWAVCPDVGRSRKCRKCSPPGVEVSRGVLEQGQGFCHYRFNPSPSFSENRTWVKDVGVGDSFGRGPQEAGQKDMRGCVLEGRSVKVYYWPVTNWALLLPGPKMSFRVVPPEHGSLGVG